MRVGLLLVWGACVPIGTTQQPDARRVTITLHSALIGPAKADGAAWDETGHVSPTEIFGAAGFAEASVTVPEAALAAIATNYVLGESSKPDSFGFADVFVGQAHVRLDIPKNNDNFAPTWNRSVHHVRWTRSTRVTLTLTDSDTVSDDPIGTVHITFRDLQSALADGKVHNVPVGDQSHNQILFVAVSVTPEGWVYESTQSRSTNRDEQSCQDAVTKARASMDMSLAEAQQLVGDCELSTWSAQTRSCVASAHSQPELQRCLPIETAPTNSGEDR